MFVLGYCKEGIFRQCGDYSQIKKAQIAVESGTADNQE